MKTLFFITIMIFAISCVKIEDNPNQRINKDEINLKNFKGKKFGKTITLKKKTKIADILKDPKSFIDKKVLVKGTVSKVCSRRGCWMQLAEGGNSIRIKVTDGVIVFPANSIGKDAIVEGVVYELNIKRNHNKHPGCSEHKKGSSCEDTNTVGNKVYQIKGLGAIIKNEI